MPNVTINPAGKTVEFTEGSRLLDILLSSGESFPKKCGGKAECGTCHIYIHEGRKSISRIQRAENERLDAIVGVSSKSRLACQVILGTENVTVEMLGFSSGF